MMLALAATVLGLTVSTPAHASRAAALTQPLYVCGLSFTAKGGGVQVIYGQFKLKGTGTIRCTDIDGNTVVMPVGVSLGGKHWAARFAVVPHMKIRGGVTGLGLLASPNAILGHYLALNGGAALGIGADGMVAIRVAKNALTFNIGLALAQGLGLEVGIDTIDITALAPAAPAPLPTVAAPAAPVQMPAPELPAPPTAPAPY